MRIHEVPPAVADARMAQALRDVEVANPGATAATGITRGQRWGLIALAVVVAMGLWRWPATVGVTLMVLSTVLYLATVLHRISLVRASLEDDPSVRVTDAAARALEDADLPVYTVLVPAYGEPEVLPDLIRSLERLEYPRDRLDVKLLLENGDEATIGAALAIETDLPVDVLVVPPGEPRTKPRALDYGLQFARGDLVTIYDAEDHPEPLQLRRVAVAFRRSPSSRACFQARLSFYGGRRNLLTRWFTAEYLTWFHLYLPGLILRDACIPLGGTSNHFRAAALRAVGGWDAHNVTEDCDLGVRLQRRGWTIGLVDSTTMEEPNTDVINWLKQRSRWYKGYLQTFLVQFRRPRALLDDLGWRRTVHLVLFVGCTPILAVMNLWFWGLAIVWVTTRAAFVQSMFPGVTYHVALLAWVLGNLSVVYLSVLTVREARRPDLLVAVLLSPLYWVLMAIAGVRAAVQLFTDPSHWEKTTHGLARHPVGPGAPGADGPGPAAPARPGVG